MNPLKFFGIDKLLKIPSFFTNNGGLINSLYKVGQQDTLKFGKQVGADEYGNKYYENNFYFCGRNRWVEYSEIYGKTHLF